MAPPSADVLIVPHYKDSTSVRYMQIKNGLTLRPIRFPMNDILIC